VPDEMSPGGSEIYRHESQSQPDELQLSRGDPELISAVESHLDECFGEAERWVLHEVLSPTIHLDVHVVPPSEAFPFQRLVTSGMAELPMTVPEGFDGTRFAEMTIALPPDWSLDEESFEDESVYWPIRLLKQLARLPHDYSTFLGYSHTIPNGDPPEPYAPDTRLCCALIAPPLVAPEGFGEVEHEGRSLNVLGVLPLYEDEMKFKLKRGTEALFTLFDQAGLTDVVDVARPSVVRRRGRFFKRR
jgi:hypothetical protein